MSDRALGRVFGLHVAVIAVLFAAQFVLPPYDHTNVARILVLSVYALGYNVLLGYTGLMSLGHAMFFAAGMYGAGLPVYYFGFGAPAALGAGILCGIVVATLFGLMALRTSGVSINPGQSALTLMSSLNVSTAESATIPSPVWSKNRWLP